MNEQEKKLRDAYTLFQDFFTDYDDGDYGDIVSAVKDKGVQQSFELLIAAYLEWKNSPAEK